METNQLERPVHLIGAKAEGFCKEWRSESDLLQPAETNYPHLVTCPACIEFMKKQFGSRYQARDEPAK